MAVLIHYSINREGKQILIKKVKLINFRRIKEDEFVPPKDEPFIIYGKNGSGKSSFLYAIRFCLYNNIPWKVSEVLRDGAKEGKVEVEFSVEGSFYKAVREFDKRSTTFRLYDSQGEDIGGGLNREARKEFRRVYPMPEEVFSHLIVRPQSKPLGEFCSATPAKMYDILKEFVDVERFEELNNVASDKISDLEEEVISLSSKIESSLSILEEVEHHDLVPLKKRAANLKEDIKSLKEEVSKAKEINSTIEEYQSAQRFISEHSDIEDWYEKWQKVSSASEPKVVYNKEKYEEYSNKLPELESEIKVIKSNVETLEKKRELKRDKLSAVSDIENDISLLKKGECPECGNEFESVEDKLASLEEERSQLREEISKLREELSDLEHFEDTLVDLKKTKASIEKYLNSAEGYKEQTELFKKKQAFLEKYPYDKKPDKLYHSYQNAKKVEEPPTQNKVDVTEIEQTLEENENKYINITKKIERLKSENEQFEKHNTLVEELETKLEDCTKDLEHLRQLEEVYSKYGAANLMVKDFLSHLQYYSNLYLDKFTKRFSVEFKSSIEMVLYDSERGNKARPFSTLSQGEKSRVAICIEFLAMGEAYESISGVPVNTGLIDEIYGLDDEAQNNFAKLLSSLKGTKEVLGGVVCFKSMANHFENVVKVEGGKINVQ